MCIFCWFKLNVVDFALLNFCLEIFLISLSLQVYSNLICPLVNIAKWLLNAFILLIFLDHTLTFYCMTNDCIADCGFTEIIYFIILN